MFCHTKHHSYKRTIYFCYSNSKSNQQSSTAEASPHLPNISDRPSSVATSSRSVTIHVPHVGGVNPLPRAKPEPLTQNPSSTITIKRPKEATSKQEDSHSSLSDASHSTTKRSTVSGTGSSHFDEHEEEGDGRVSRRNQRRDSSSHSRSRSHSKSSSEHQGHDDDRERNRHTKSKPQRSRSSSSSASDVTDVSPLPTARSDDELTRNKEKRQPEDSARSKSGDRIASKPPAGPTRARQTRAEGGSAVGTRLSWDLDSERRESKGEQEDPKPERSRRQESSSKSTSSTRSLRARAHSADRAERGSRGRGAWDEEEADPEKMNLEAVLQTLIDLESSRALPTANANASGRLHSRPATASSSAAATSVVPTLSPYLETLSRPTSSSQRSAHSRAFRTLRDDQLSGIQKENLRLLQQIISERNLQPHPPNMQTDQAALVERARALEHARRVALLEKLAPVRRPAPATYQRQKERDRIARENELLVKRLRRIQPTRELTRNFLIGDYQKLYSGAFGLGLAGTHGTHQPNDSASASALRSRPTSAAYGKSLHTAGANARVAWEADVDDEDEPAALALKSSKPPAAAVHSQSAHALRTLSGFLTRERERDSSRADEGAAPVTAATAAESAERIEPHRVMFHRAYSGTSERTHSGPSAANDDRSESGSVVASATATATGAGEGKHKEKHRRRYRRTRTDESEGGAELLDARHSGRPALAQPPGALNSSGSRERIGANDLLRAARRPDSAHSRASRADSATPSASATAFDKGLSPAAAMLAMRNASTRTVRF